MHGEQIKNFEKSYNIDWGRSIGGGYDIKVHAEDVNGNVAKYKTHMDGVLGALLKLILKILTAIAEAIAALAALFIDWIWKAIRGMFDCVFKPITNGIKGFIKSIGKSLTTCYSEYKDTGDGRSQGENKGEVSKKSVENIYKTIFENKFFRVMNALLTILGGILTLISPFLSLVSGLLSRTAKFVSPIIQSAVAPGSSKDKKEGSKINTEDDSSVIKSIEKYLSDLEGYSEIIAITSIIISVLSILLTLYARSQQWIISLGKEILLGIGSLLCSIVSYSLIYTYVPNFPDSFDSSEFFFYAGLGFGILAIFLAYKGFKSSLKASNAIYKAVGIILNSIGLALGCLSILTTTGQYINRPYIGEN